MTPCLKEESLQAYLDGELSPDARVVVLAHLADCAHCANSARTAEQALAAIGSAFDDELPAVIPTARLRARIESALAESVAPQSTLASLFWRFSQRRAAWIAASVLAVASVVGWFVVGTRSSTIPKPEQREAQAGAPTPLVTPGPQTPLPVLPTFKRDLEVAQQALTSRPRRRVRHQASGNDSDEAEVVTQFFPLREGEDLTALESARLVRIELPGSALGEVGLPVDPETANVPVKADVVLGQDGLARAIRFVR